MVGERRPVRAHDPGEEAPSLPLVLAAVHAHIAWMSAIAGTEEVVGSEETAGGQADERRGSEEDQARLFLVGDLSQTQAAVHEETSAGRRATGHIE